MSITSFLFLLSQWSDDGEYFCAGSCNISRRSSKDASPMGAGALTLEITGLNHFLTCCHAPFKIGII